MTREEAKEFLPLIKAFADGKTIEYTYNNVRWFETNCPFTDFWFYKYRIKE